MGRGRLRRGCSLEVIFEEDPDFCSHLDSLDGGVAIRFGIKEPDDTISLDSLLEVEEYQVRFQDPADAEEVFRSLDGFIDVRSMDSCMVEWDEFSMDSNNSSKFGDETGNVVGNRADPSLDHNDLDVDGGNIEKAPNGSSSSGRRSRVSRRQIIQATWLGYCSSSDESVGNNEVDENIDIACSGSGGDLSESKTHRRRSPNNPHQKIKGRGAEAETKSDGADEQTSTSSTAAEKCSNSFAVKSTSSNAPNLVTSVEDFLEAERKEEQLLGLRTPIQLQLRTSPNNNTDGVQHAIFGRSDSLDFVEKDTLDSYISTMTDETDTNAYTFADPFDDTHSVASTNYESSSGSTSSTESNGSVCTVNSFSMQNGKSKSNENEDTSGTNSSNGASSSSNGSGATSESSSASNYRNNLKVELMSQLNKSQEGNLHSTPTTSATVNPTKLYAGNSRLETPAITDAPSATSSPNVATLSKLPIHQPLHRQQPLLSHHHPLSDQERQLLGGEVKRVRALFELRNHSRTSLNGSERSGSSSNGSTCPSSPESTSRSVSSRNNGAASPSGSCSGRVGLYSKNGRRSRISPQSQHGSSTTTAASPNKLLRSAYNNVSLTQMSNAPSGSNPNIHGGSPGAENQPYDYVNLLVNDNVVIEDAPDIYQTIRSRRNGNSERDNSAPSPQSLAKRPITLMSLGQRDAASPLSISSGSLRRSQSMGTGISSLGSSSAYGITTEVLKPSSSKTNILAEELPAPDTVKNVRNVFENMLKRRGNNTSHGSTSSVDATNSTISTGFSGSFSIVKKSLSYIKSNPSSKIYRSESMRDDFPSMGRRYGKPVLMSETNSPAHSPCYSSFVAPTSTSPTSSSAVIGSALPLYSTTNNKRGARCTVEGGDVVDCGHGFGGSGSTTQRSSSVSPMNRNPIERKISEPAKFSPKINTGLNPSSVPSMLRSSCQVPLTEEDSSFTSSAIAEDYRTRKYVHADVLQKIRSAGTTTTYFGGKIVGKTIKNRKIPVSRRHTFDFQDYVGISGERPNFANYDSYSSTNYYRDDETSAKHHHQVLSRRSMLGGRASGGNAGRKGGGESSRPALDIPLKSSSSTSNIYSSHNATISGALDSIFGGVGGLLTFASKPIDTTPRIISVLHKSPPGSQAGSPVKSCSPVSSVIEEGRNSPEGCESSNEKALLEQDGNNNNLPGKIDPSARKNNCIEESDSFNEKFSQITEGAWF